MGPHTELESYYISNPLQSFDLGKKIQSFDVALV